MSSGESLQLEARRQTLTVPVARQVLFYSFYFSQGTPEIQENLFTYIHLIRPAWRLDNENWDALFALASPIEHFANLGFHEFFQAGQDRIIEELDAIVPYLYLILNGNPALPAIRDVLVGELMADIIAKDYRYLVEYGRRPKTEVTYAAQHPGYGYNPMIDPYLSHFCYYALLGNTCGVPEFDELFAEVGMHVQERTPVFAEVIMQHDVARDKLKDVIAAFNLHHDVAVQLDSLHL